MKLRFATLVMVLWFAENVTHAVEPMPDFQLKDENSASPRYTKTVSPRDHILQVSGYYFGDSG